MANQGLFQGGQHREPLLAQGREIAANTAEGHSASRRAETAGDLLLHFDHPNIPLGQTVGLSRQLHRLRL